MKFDDFDKEMRMIYKGEAGDEKVYFNLPEFPVCLCPGCMLEYRKGGRQPG